MKLFTVSLRSLLFTAISVSCFSLSLAQNVNFEINVTKVRWDAMGDQSGGPDPTWKVWAKDNVDGTETGGSCMSKQNISTSGGTLTNWDGPALPYLIRSKTGTSATTITLRNDWWEDDCPVGDQCDFDNGTLCAATVDDDRCQNSTLASIAFRSANPCTTYYYPGASTTSGSASGNFYNCGKFGAQISIRWEYADAPTITVQPTANSVLCAGQTVALSFTTNTDAQGRSMGRLFQWQISRATSCSPTPSDWMDITGATSATYTPKEIAGTRLYRCRVSSNCTDVNITYVNTSCAAVTYNPMDGRTPVSPPSSYGTGDNRPVIQSSICGTTILPGSVHTLSALATPAVGAAANVTYSWSASPAGGAVSPSTGTTITYTAPSSPGTYWVKLTYVDNCGATDTSYTCPITVGSPQCNFIYVSPSGTNSSTCGGPDNPCQNLSGTNGAIAKVVSGTQYIRMANGSYTEGSIVNLSTGLVIEGGYSVSSGIWDKTSASTTNITCSGTGLGTVTSTTGHLMGFGANAVNNWKLIDLNITTSGTSATTSGGYGYSNYAVWINGCTGYEITRCSITSGAAANGTTGTGKGNVGSPGNTANGGSGGSCDGANGGNGGSAVTGPGSGTRKGGDGGAGGKGGNEGKNNGAAGSLGSNGGNSAARDPGAGGGGGWGDPGNQGGDASASVSTTEATVGGTGSGYTANVNRATNYTTSTYFVPGQGASGNDGDGGGGGAGGGGGGAQSCSTCNDGGGNGGGSGGTGGQGGEGGAGGYGAGGSFAVYISGTAIAPTNSVLAVPGSLATGGNGQGGGLGGNGSNGGSGAAVCTGEIRRGGNGSKGANGGPGGRGQDGNNGINFQYWTGSGTNPGGSIPSSQVIKVITNNGKICKNSVFSINNTSGSGAWTLPANFNFTDYNNDGSQDYGSTNFPADVSVGNAVTAPSYNNLIAGSVTFNSYLWVASDARPAPVITIKANDGSTLSPAKTICNGGTVQLTATSYGTQTQYLWEVFSGDWQAKGYTGANLVFSSTSASPVTSALSTGTYYVRYQVREQCCGWSVPVFETITVNADPTAPTSVTAVPALSPVCSGQTLSISSPTGSTGGIPTYNYEYDIATPSATYDDIYSATNSVSATTSGSYGIKVRVQAITLKGCDASPAFTNPWTVVDQPSLTMTKFPSTTTICEGNNVSADIVLAGGTGCTDVSEYRYDGTGGWTAYTSGTDLSTVGYTQVEIRAKRDGCTAGAGCTGTGYTTFSWTVTPPPSSGTVTKSPNLSAVCEGATVSATFGTGSDGVSCTDIKQYRYDGTGGWSTYTAPLSTTGHTKVEIQNYRGNCAAASGCADATPTVVSWDVVSNPILSSPATPQSICKGGTASISSTSSGGTGNYDYQWQYSATGTAGSWSNVTNGVPLHFSYSGATSSNVPTGTTSTLTITGDGSESTGDKYYQLVLTSNTATLASCTGTSASAKVTTVTNPLLSPTPPDATICKGGTTTLTTAASGGTGRYGYIWTYSTDNSYTVNTVVANGLPSGISYNASPTNTLVVTGNGSETAQDNFYRLTLVDTGSGCPNYSVYTKVTVVEDPVLSGPSNDTVCQGASTILTTSVTSGGTGTFNYQWQYSANGSTWGNVADQTPAGVTYTGATTSTLNLSASMSVTVGNNNYYRALLTTNTPTGAGCDATSSSSRITFIAAPTATPVLDKIFTCDASAQLSAINISSGATISWTKVSGSGTPSSSTNNPLLVTGLTQGATTVYRLLVSNTGCSNVNNGTVNIVMPTLSSTSIASSASCGYCVLTDGVTRTYYNNSGELIAQIVDDPSVTPAQLDSTEVCVRINPSVQVIEDNFGNLQPYLQRQWTIHPVNNTKAKVTLYFKNTELTALQSAANPTKYQFSGYDLWVTKYPGGNNGQFTPACTGGTPGCGRITGEDVPATFSAFNGDSKVVFEVNSFSTFYIHPALFPFAPLPVELTSFTGWNQGNVNKLQWITASEVNTNRFEIQKSLAGSTWFSLGEKPAFGNSNQVRVYDFTDNAPVIGNNYYRLKIYDNDGQFTFSNIINIPIVEAVVNGFISVFPNPTTGDLNIVIQSTEMFDAKIVAFDLVGKKVYEKPVGLTKGLNVLKVDFNALPKGAYLLQFMDNDGQQHITKFVKD